MILTENKNPTKFEDVSTLFHSIQGEESELFAEVYAPLFTPTEADKNKKKERCISELKKIFAKSVDLQQELAYTVENKQKR